MTEEKGKYFPNQDEGGIPAYYPTPTSLPLVVYAKKDETAQNSLGAKHFVYCIAWLSAISMLWCIFLGVVEPSTLRFALFIILILIGIINYPAEVNELKAKNKQGGQ